MKKLEKIRFGVEIEVEFPDTKDSSDLINKHRLIRGWTVDYDGSLDNGAEYKPKDSNKLYIKEDTIDQIKEIIGLIKAHKGTIRPTCGFHVHVDMSKFTSKEIVNIVKAFIEEQDKIYKDFKVIKSRYQTARKLPKSWRNKVTEKSIRALKHSKYNNMYTEFNDRYYGLNISALENHGTLEFRFYNGTIQARKIIGHVKWAINFCIRNCKNGHKKD